MLKHNPKLNKLWQKARKIKKDDGMVYLDWRTSASKEFSKELLKTLLTSTSEEDK